MKKFLKWTLIVLGTIVLIAVITVLYFKSSVDGRLNKQYNITVEDIVIPTDTASLLKGQHLSLHCKSCHGFDFSGRHLFGDEKVGMVDVPNITGGKGSVVVGFTDKDWIRVLRHGVKPDGKPLVVMPSEVFNNFTEDELKCLIAYMKTVKKIDKSWEPPYLTTMGKVLVHIGAFGNLLSAEMIDHNKKIVPFITPEVTAKYGEHLVESSGCKNCHGKELNGHKDPNPKAPMAPNLTPGGDLGKWTSDDFIRALRTGETPEGKSLKKEFMPWESMGLMTDDELKAVFLYLQSQPKLATAKG
jgi:cytochrome c553